MRGLPILSYHAIDDSGSVISTSPVHFRRTLAILHGEGFRCVDLQDWIDAGRPSWSRVFAITFDDGLDSIRVAAEIMARWSCRASAFLVTGHMGRDNAWRGQPRGIPRMRMLPWSALGELASAGFRFGAHTVTHPHARECSIGQINREIVQSRKEIEDRTGQACGLFAYPYGDVTKWARSLASRHFSAAFGTRLAYARGDENPSEISRVDAFYLRSEKAIKAIVEETLPRTIALRRVARAGRSILAMASRSVTNVKGYPNSNRPRDEFASSPRDTSAYFKRLPGRICPTCRNLLHEGLRCLSCESHHAQISGIADLRLRSDRYLTLEDERGKARSLAEKSPDTNLHGLAQCYYDMTEDVDESRRRRYLAHIARAETRGERLADRLSVNEQILEVGCGTGGLLVAARRRGMTIEGVDLAMRWLVMADRRLGDADESCRLTAACTGALPWPDASFDCVVADSLLEHLDDPAQALREWHRVVRPGGRLIVWSPNRFSIAPDPHVGLVGLGWLPRRWQAKYVEMRRGIDWPIRVMSSREAHRLATRAGWIVTKLGPAPMPVGRADHRGVRFLSRFYDGVRERAFLRAFFRSVGPLWELHAVRGSNR